MPAAFASEIGSMQVLQHSFLSAVTAPAFRNWRLDTKSVIMFAMLTAYVEKPSITFLQSFWPTRYE